MKNLKRILLIAILFASVGATQAQVSVNVNIGSRPVWCPEEEYSTVDFYYLPEVQSYYDVRSSQFVYLSQGRWIRNKNLPSRYRSYDLRKSKRVSLKGYKGNAPYAHFHNHEKVIYVKKPTKVIVKSNNKHVEKHDKHEEKHEKHKK